MKRGTTRWLTAVSRASGWPGSRSVGTSALLVAALTLLSTLTGFVRELVIGRGLGATGETDAFLAAFAIVSFVFLIFTGGALQGAFMPTYQKLQTSNEQGEARGLLVSTSMVIGGIGLVLSIALVVWSDQIIGLVYAGFSTGVQATAATAMRLLAPIVTLAIAGNLAQSVLNARNAFVGPASVPFLTNMVVIATLVVMAPVMGIQALPLGYLIGYLPWLVLFVSVLRQPGGQTAPVSPASRKAVAASFAALGLFGAFDQVSSLLQRSLLSWFEPGLLSAFAYGSRLAGLPISILISALGVVLFPRLVLNTEADHSYGKSDIVYVGIISTLAIILPIALFMAMEADLIVALLYSGSQMTTEAIANTSSVFVFYALALPAQALIMILYRIFMAAGRNYLLVTISVMAGGLQIAMTYLAASYLGWQGVPIATLLYSYIYCIALLVAMFRFTTVPRCVYARGLGIIMVAGLLAVGVGLIPFDGSNLAFAALRGFAMVTVFAGACLLLGERSLLQLFRR